MRLGAGSLQAMTDEKLEETIATLMKERDRRQRPQCPPMIESPNWEPLMSLTAELIEESFEHGYLGKMVKDQVFECVLLAVYGKPIFGLINRLDAHDSISLDSE